MQIAVPGQGRSDAVWAAVASGAALLGVAQTAAVLGAAGEAGTPRVYLAWTALVATVVVLALSGWRRWAPGLLSGVPGGLLIALLAMPEAAAARLMSGAAFAAWLATVVVFLTGASLWTGGAESEDDGLERLPVEGAAARPTAFGRVREGIGIALLVVPALWLAARPIEEGAEATRLLAMLMLTFVWVVALYAFFIAPALGEEVEAHEAGRAEQRARRRGLRSRPATRLAITVAGLAIVAALMASGLLGGVP